MAKATVKMVCKTCGAEYTWTKTDFYNRGAADKWVAWNTEHNVGTCPDCWAAEQKAKKEAEILAQKGKTPKIEMESPIPLPTLTGSDKQVSWARDIRAQFLDALCGSGIKWDNVMANADHPRVKPELDKLLNPAAKWWIDNRTGTIFGKYAI